MDDQTIIELTAYTVASEFYAPNRDATDRFTRTLIFCHSLGRINLLGDFDEACERARWILDVLDQDFGGLGGTKLLPKLEDPCPADGRHGRHELYMAGPGGKRGPPKENWQCCQACGANGPIDRVSKAFDDCELTSDGRTLVLSPRSSGKTKAMKEATDKARAEGKTVIEINVGSMKTKGANSPNIVMGDFRPQKKDVFIHAYDNDVDLASLAWTKNGAKVIFPGDGSYGFLRAIADACIEGGQAVAEVRRRLAGAPDGHFVLYAYTLTSFQNFEQSMEGHYEFVKTPRRPQRKGR